VNASEVSTDVIRSFSELRVCARHLGPKRVAVVVADDEIALTAAMNALREGIAIPVLIGDESKIRRKAQELGMEEALAHSEVVDAPADTAACAARMAGSGAVSVLLKGHLRTDELLRAVLDKQYGLRTGRLLCDVVLFEDVLSGTTRLVALTDGGVNVAPTLEQKKAIVVNAIEVMRTLGVARPKVAILSASDAVSPAMPSTQDAAALSEMGNHGGFGEADVYGPIQLDAALMESAARIKGVSSPVAGCADCLIVPNIEAGNLLGKALPFFAGIKCAHIVVGAKVPVLIPSRSESAEDKVNAIAMGVICAAG